MAEGVRDGLVGGLMEDIFLLLFISAGATPGGWNRVYLCVCVCGCLFGYV